MLKRYADALARRCTASCRQYDSELCNVGLPYRTTRLPDANDNLIILRRLWAFERERLLSLAVLRMCSWRHETKPYLDLRMLFVSASEVALSALRARQTHPSLRPSFRDSRVCRSTTGDWPPIIGEKRSTNVQTTGDWPPIIGEDRRRSTNVQTTGDWPPIIGEDRKRSTAIQTHPSTESEDF